MASNQLVSIQVLRAIAAMAVLVAHTHYVIGIVLGVEGYPSLVTGAAGVDLFFVISGFVMVYASEPIFGHSGAPVFFWSRRVIRIVPLYWTMTTALLIYLTARYAGGIGYVGQTWQGVVASYLFIPYPGADGALGAFYAVGWTLNFEMFFYLVFGLLVWLPRRAAVLTVAATLSLFCAFGEYLRLPVALNYLSSSIILEFVFGMLVALAYREGLRLPRVFALALIPVGFVAIAATMNFEAAPRCLYWGLPATCIVAGCVFAGDPKPSIGWKAAAFVGDCSYALYLVHPVALSFPRQIGINFAHSHPFAYCLFIVAVAIACGIAVHLFFERPVTIFLRHSKVSFSSPSPAA